MANGRESILDDIKEGQSSTDCPELMLEEKLVDVLLTHALGTLASNFLACKV